MSKSRKQESESEDILSSLSDPEGKFDSEPLVDYTPTVSELKILARHYVDAANEPYFFASAHDYGISGSEHWQMRYAHHKLEIIEERLGKEAFEKAIKSTVEGWKRDFEKLSSGNGEEQ